MHLYLFAIFLSAVLCAVKSLHRFSSVVSYSPTIANRSSFVVSRPPFNANRLSPTIYRRFTPDRRKIVLNLEDVLSPWGTDLKRRRTEATCAFFQEILGMDEHTARRKMDEYLTNYTSILDGLVAENRVDPMAFEEYLGEKIDYQSIRPNRALAEMLENLDADVVILSKDDPMHAEKALERLEILPYIHAIFPLPKKFRISLEKTDAKSAFAQLESFLDTSPSLISYVDNSEYCLFIAEDLDWNPINVNWHHQFDARFVFPTISTIYDLPQVFKPVITPERE